MSEIFEIHPQIKIKPAGRDRDLQDARVDAVTACGLALMYPGTEINLIDQKSQPPAKIVVPSGFQRAGSVRNRINGLAKKLALHF